MFATIVCCLAIVYLAYKYFTANFDYWRKRNVPHEKPIAVFGNFAPVIFMRKSIGDIFEDLHKKYRESPLVGFYKLTTPCLLLTTPEYVEQAFVQDSNFFWQNEFTIQPDVDPIAAKGSFFLKGQKWKKSRGLFTPLLSNAKMKHVTPLMVRATAKMLEYIDKKKVLETRDLMSRYVSEASALATFGVEAESFDKDDAFYRALGRKLTEPDGYNAIKTLTMVLAPKLAKFLKLKFIPDDSVEFVRQTIKTALKHRKDNNLKHNDFLEFIMSLKNDDFDDDDVLAWSFGFFTEPNTSNQSSYILYCLAKHEDVQSKLRTEINRVLDKYNGDVCFEALQEMTYLHCVIQETMRLHPSLRMNMKKCTGYYEFPTPNGQKEVINLEPGMSIAVSIYAMQTDERYFENPMEFDPDRFSDKREGNFAKGAYMPFGLGKRMCAGMKLAQNLMKISTVILVKEYELSLNERTKEPLDLDPKYNPIAVPKSGLWINFNKL